MGTKNPWGLNCKIAVIHWTVSVKNKIVLFPSSSSSLQSFHVVNNFKNLCKIRHILFLGPPKSHQLNFLYWRFELLFNTFWRSRDYWLFGDEHNLESMLYRTWEHALYETTFSKIMSLKKMSGICLIFIPDYEAPSYTLNWWIYWQQTFPVMVLLLAWKCFTLLWNTNCNAGNDDRSTVNDCRNLSFDRLKYVMTSHSDGQLLLYLQCVFFLWNHVFHEM